jgi:outer membrane cobalamin receptor
MKTFYQKLFAVLLVLLSVPTAVFAAETESKKDETNPVTTVVEAPFKVAEGLVNGAFDLGNLIVGGKRLGSPFSEHVSKSVSSTNVITEEEIDSSGVTTVPEAILKSPGFAFSDLNGNSEEPSLEARGLRVGSDFVFMLDGVKLNEPKSGNVNFPLIPLHLVEQIEISRGGTSSLYGEGARGGAINVVPKKPTQEGFHSTVETMAGSYDSWGENFESFYKKDSDNLYMTGELYHTRGFRESTSVEKENFYTKYVRDLSDTTQAGWFLYRCRQSH